MNDDASDALSEVARSLEKLATRHDELLEVLRTQAAKDEAARAEAIALHRQAMARVRWISVAAGIGILACLVLIVFLILRYDIL